MPDFVLTEQFIELEERDESDQGEESESGDQERQAGQHDKTGNQQPAVPFRTGFLMIHFSDDSMDNLLQR
jgi:hypothetical protein